MKRLLAASGLIFGATFLTGCVITPRPVGYRVVSQGALAAPGPYSRTSRVVLASYPPPPLLIETIPAQPYADAQWIPGYWDWNGATWIWVGGRYSNFSNYTWFGPTYVTNNSGCVFSTGYYQEGPPPRRQRPPVARPNDPPKRRRRGPAHTPGRRAPPRVKAPPQNPTVISRRRVPTAPTFRPRTAPTAKRATVPTTNVNTKRIDPVLSRRPRNAFSGPSFRSRPAVQTRGQSRFNGVRNNRSSRAAFSAPNRSSNAGFMPKASGQSRFKASSSSRQSSSRSFTPSASRSSGSKAAFSPSKSSSSKKSSSSSKSYTPSRSSKSSRSAPKFRSAPSRGKRR